MGKLKKFPRQAKKRLRKKGCGVIHKSGTNWMLIRIIGREEDVLNHTL
jgi:hypothetical protein